MSLPITELAIGRFRGLRDVTLQGLGRVNILVGPNNSGKTSVLEALSLVANPLHPMEWMQTVVRRDPFSPPLRPRFLGLRWLFPQDASNHPSSSYDGTITLNVVGTIPLQGLRAHYKVLRSLQGPAKAAGLETPVDRVALRDSSTDERDVERRGARLEISATYSDSNTRRESFTWWEDERFEFPSMAPTISLPTQIVTAYDHWDTPLIIQEYSSARLAGQADELARLLALVDPRIAGMEVLSASALELTRRNDAVLYIRDRAAGLLPLDAFGVGIHRMLLIAIALYQARGGILLIDELEAGIHISALGRAFRWIVKACADNNVQLFATTHSLEAIDALIAADDTPDHEDIVGYRLESSENGVTARRYGEDLLRRLRMERGLEIR